MAVYLKQPLIHLRMRERLPQQANDIADDPPGTNGLAFKFGFHFAVDMTVVYVRTEWYRVH